MKNNFLKLALEEVGLVEPTEVVGEPKELLEAQTAEQAEGDKLVDQLGDVIKVLS